MMPFNITAIPHLAATRAKPDIYHAIYRPADHHIDFFEIYHRRGYLECDPVFKLMQQQRGPFTWHEVNRLDLTKKQREVMQTRHDHRLRSGISMSVHSADTNLIGMSVAAEDEKGRTDAEAVGKIYAICNQFQLTRAKLMGKVKLELPSVQLSPREKEMLQWCSHGKSNSVIADILGISEKTVEYHLGSAFKKLDVTSRTSAVLKAVQMKLILVPA
jgi:DNA-binding CsgD family transcriptional regulator